MCSMSINFMLQVIRIVHIGNFTDTEIQMIYDFILNLDNETLIHYYNTNSVVSYNNDLELYLEIIDLLIKIFEEQEQYEKCGVLLNKKNESLFIINKKTNEYV